MYAYSQQYVYALQESKPLVCYEIRGTSMGFSSETRIQANQKKL